MPPELPMVRRTEKVATWSELGDRQPAYALVEGVDLVVIRYDDQVSVLYGRCHHRGALLADGFIDGENLICGLHFWDYRYDSGVSEYNNEEALDRFTAWVDEDQDAVLVDAGEIAEWVATHPQPYRRDEYLGLYQDIHGTPEEPHNRHIHTTRGAPLRKALDQAGYAHHARGPPFAAALHPDEPTRRDGTGSS